MAQISVVQLPPGALGRIGPVPQLRDLTNEEFLALGTLLGGLGTALGLFLYATGRSKEAYALGIAAGVTGAFVGAARLTGGGGSE